MKARRGAFHDEMSHVLAWMAGGGGVAALAWDVEARTRDKLGNRRSYSGFSLGLGQTVLAVEVCCAIVEISHILNISMEACRRLRIEVKEVCLVEVVPGPRRS